MPLNGNAHPWRKQLFAFQLTTGGRHAVALVAVNPNLYSLQTLVSVGGAVVDSSMTKIGLRFFSWSANTPGGLSVNGTLTKLKGVCLAQFMGWIENAVPDSRFAKQVAMIKGHGHQQYQMFALSES